MKITSSALFFVSGCLSTGMPRPSSAIGDRAAVLVQRHDDVRGEAVHRLVDGVVEDLPDQVMQAGGADAADVHAGALADRLEPFENGDVFGGVVGRHATVLKVRISARIAQRRPKPERSLRRGVVAVAQLALASRSPGCSARVVSACRAARRRRRRLRPWRRHRARAINNDAHAMRRHAARQWTVTTATSAHARDGRRRRGATAGRGARRSRSQIVEPRARAVRRHPDLRAPRRRSRRLPPCGASSGRRAAATWRSIWT